ncbi:MAG TPA: hypothetical protein VH598_01895 [Verrucomicrobiae bacterium]|nr:hypothetical protein [Verrucomicrobiae bacterium]
MRLCDWLYERLGRQHSIALAELGELLFQFLTEIKKLPVQSVANALWRDYQRGGRTDLPLFLRPYLPNAAVSRRDRSRPSAPKRQERHLARSF